MPARTTPRRCPRLKEGDIRDAAEKAWCATKRAEEPGTTSMTTNGLDALAGVDRRLGMTNSRNAGFSYSPGRRYASARPGWDSDVVTGAPGTFHRVKNSTNIGSDK